MSTPKQSRARHSLDRWRDWRRARNQRWVEKQAAKRPGDVYSQWGKGGAPDTGGGPGM